MLTVVYIFYNFIKQIVKSSICNIPVITLLAFTILLSGCAPFFRLVNYSPSAKVVDVTFTNDIKPNYKFAYSDTTGNEYLRKLQVNYGLDTLTQNANNQFGKVLLVLNWTHQQWKHSGSNEPKKSDALSILEEAKAGKNFRCVEYGIVSAAALNSIGLPARVIGLKTRDVEKIKYGAGHVAAEVYIPELKKWVLLDGQFNAIPMLNDVPLNSVELKQAVLANKPELKIVSIKGVANDSEKARYLSFVSKYLFYFDVNFDNRIGETDSKLKVNDKTKLMLVPLKAKIPTVFQRKYPINYCEYTNSITDFYKEPVLK